jgi:hypothetical protein
MLMICYDPTAEPPSGPSRQADHARLEQEMRDNGHYLGGAGLWPLEISGRVVRPEGEGRTVLDGPFTETKEALGGFFVVDCGEDEALEYAKRISVNERSWVQVRKVGLWHPA